MFFAWCNLGGPDSAIGPGDGTQAGQADHVQYAVVTVGTHDSSSFPTDVADAKTHWAALDGKGGVTRGLTVTFYRTRFQYGDNTIQIDVPFTTITECRFENAGWWWVVGAVPNTAPWVSANGVATPEAASHVDQILFNNPVRFADTDDSILIERS